MKKGCVLAVLFLLTCGAVQAEKLIIGIQPGAVFNLGGGFDRWKSGFGFAGHVFFGLSQKVALGAQLTMNFISPDPETFIGFSSGGYTFTSIDTLDGSGHDLSLFALVRIYPGSAEAKTKFFIQGGVGYDFAGVTVNSISGPTTFRQWWGTGTGYTTMSFSPGYDYSGNSLGVAVSPGVSIPLGNSLRLEICPKLNFQFTEDGMTTIFTLAASMSIVR